MRFIVSAFLSMFALIAIGQINSNGVVISSDPADRPHHSAILDVNTNTPTTETTVRGIQWSIIDKGSNDYAKIIEDLNKLEDTPDGLMYYVKNSNNTVNGIYYFDKNKTKDGSWLKLATQNDNAMTIPDGTIIMYAGTIDAIFDAKGAGIVGTTGEGWHICNGESGTPDLSSKFLMCANLPYRDKGTETLSAISSSYKLGDHDEGDKKTKITYKNVASHDHGVKPIKLEFPHSHSSIILPNHSHEFESEYGKKNEDVSTMGRKKQKDSKILGTRKSNRETKSSNYPATGTTGIMVGGDFRFDLPKTQDDWMKPKQEGTCGKALDVRPPYYVVYYIMKNTKKKDYDPKSPTYEGK